MRVALFLSLTFACTGVACSSAEPPRDDVVADTGTEPPRCAEGLSCNCGDVTCASDEFCHSESFIGAEEVRACRRFHKGAACAEAPCAEDQLCAAAMINGAAGVVCSPRPALGERCNLSNDIDENSCGPGAYCGDARGKVGSVCVASAPSGASCETLSKFACPTGETCQSVIFPELKCLPAGKAGARCLNSPDCGIGLYCTKPGDRCAPRKGVGEPCDPTLIDAIAGECARFLKCDGGTCRAQ